MEITSLRKKFSFEFSFEFSFYAYNIPVIFGKNGLFLVKKKEGIRNELPHKRHHPDPFLFISYFWLIKILKE